MPLLEDELHSLASSKCVPLGGGMFETNRQLPWLKQRLCRLMGNRIEVVWIRGSELDPIIGEPEWIEQAVLEMALRARAAMPYGGRMVVESCNIDLDEFSAASEVLTAGRYVMIEMTCLRHRPDEFDPRSPFSSMLDTYDDLWLESQPAESLRILRAIGGNICEYNEPGRALTLRAFLPSAATVIYSDEEDFVLSPSPTPDAILLVEDEAYVREVACEILESAGYTVVMATSAKEALAVFEKDGPFSLLLTDIVMPGMNGRELAKTLASRKPDLKTIYMSGYTDSAIIRQDLLSPCHTYIQKPFTLEGLTETVKQVLASSAPG